MIKKIAFVIVFLSLTSCETLKEKSSGITEMGSIGKTCPPKNERTLRHFFCKEPK